MTTITIQAEEELVTALKQVARAQFTTVEALAKEAVVTYLRRHSSQSKSAGLSLSKSYSFIGIGHSGQGNISTQVDATLKTAANRREGWSLSE